MIVTVLLLRVLSTTSFGAVIGLAWVGQWFSAVTSLPLVFVVIFTTVIYEDKGRSWGARRTSARSSASRSR